jgi:ParB/RepB/Spo0J family partition protein
MNNNTSVWNIPLERITDNPYQLRTTYDPAATQELALSIATNGLLQPPLGRIMLKDQVLAPEQYGGVLPCLNAEPDAIIQLVFGHRRKRAYEYLNAQQSHNGWQALPVQVCQFTDEEMGINAHIENEQRADLDPIEEATGIRKLMDEFHWTQAQAAEKLGLSRSSLANKLRLLKLPPSVQDRVHANKLSERQALAVLPFFTLPAEIQEAASQNYGGRRLRDSIQAGESSVELRQRVDWAIRDATVSLDEGLFPLDQVCVAWENNPAVRAVRCQLPRCYRPTSSQPSRRSVPLRKPETTDIVLIGRRSKWVMKSILKKHWKPDVSISTWLPLYTSLILNAIYIPWITQTCITSAVITRVALVVLVSI